MGLSLFGLLILDRDPYFLSDLPGLVQAWAIDAGGFGMIGLLVYILYALTIPAAQAESAKYRAGVTSFMLIMAVLALLVYALYLAMMFTGRGYDYTNPKFYVDPNAFTKYVPHKLSFHGQPLALTIGGLLALLGIGQPFAANMLKIRGRRLWAVAKLSFKEAIRSKLLWVFLIFLLPILFPARLYSNIKPENELRSTIAISTFFMNILLLAPALILASFGLPRDIKDQNIFTVLTKPVERFEIVFGRFLGYVGVLTIGLVLMTVVGWLFLWTAGVDEKAAEETYKARVPVRGGLKFQSRKTDFEGTNVGREFDYRRYVAGDPSSPQRAIWTFNSIPSGLTAGRDYVPCEFTFDIFRMTKGVENRGVDLIIRVTTWQNIQLPPTEPRDGSWKWENPDKEAEYQEEAKAKLRKLRGLGATDDVNPATVFRFAEPGSPEWDVLNELTEKYGFYEIVGKEIFDYHPESVNIPVGIFKNASSGFKTNDLPAVSIAVKCQTGGQMLGVAEGDLYLLEGERLFVESYFRAAFGLWCRLCIVVGISVVLSTYLAAVIALLGAAAQYLAGYAIDHISDMASGNSFAGGPGRALVSLIRAETATAQPDPKSSVDKAFMFGDGVFSWLVRRVANMVPDVYSYSWTGYVSEGFNVPLECMVMNLITTIGYLLPWFILSFYLMRSREVAA